MIISNCISALEKYITLFCIAFSSFIIILLTLLTPLALLSLFRLPLIMLSLFISLILTVIFVLKIRIDIDLIPRVTIFPALIIVLVLIIFIFFPHDTFGGRDEASYTNWAVHLSQTGTLQFPDYLTKNPNPVVMSKLGLPAYIIWIATQKILFGTQWFLRSNIILIAFGLTALFQVASLFNKKGAGIITLILFSTSMPFLWFSREIMTENLSFFLLWILFLFLFLFLRSKKYIYLILIFLGGFLFSLTRIEGFFIQLILVASIFLTLLFSKTKNKKIFIIVITYLLLQGIYIFIAIHYSFDYIFNGMLPMLQKNLPHDISSVGSGYSIGANISEPFFKDKIPAFVMQMLSKYNFILLIFSIFFILIKSILDYKKNKKVNLTFIYLFIIISPEFLKLFTPAIIVDQPWLYRRYLYAILPFGFLSFSLLLYRLKNQKLLLFLFGCFLVINILLSRQIIFHKNNWLLHNKLEDITKEITKNDFVIVKTWTLRQYYSASFIHLQKHVRLAFTTQMNSVNFDPKSNLVSGYPYNKLYLLSHNSQETYPNFVVKEKKKVKLKYDQLEPTCQLYILGSQLRMSNPYEYTSLPYSEVINFCSKPDMDIRKYDQYLYLFELIYENTPHG